MTEEKKNKLISGAVTVAVHLLLVLLLVLLGFTKPVPEEESGVLLQVGLVEAAAGNGRPGGTPSVTPAPPTPPAPVEPSKPATAPEQPLIAQQDDPAPAIAAQQEKERQRREAEAKAQVERERKAREEAERRQREEQERLRREEEERKAREAAAIDDQLAGAFGSGKDGSNGSQSGQSAQGSPQGNSNTGAATGSAGRDTYYLGGRGLRGSLPRPSFNVNESGTVVVSIIVDAAGNVTSATIGRGTTTSSRTLRDAAIAAARKARFEPKPGASAQTGTITYRFDSDN